MYLSRNWSYLYMQLTDHGISVNLLIIAAMCVCQYTSFALYSSTVSIAMMDT